jgi:cytochrome c-type biogenesis protein CcmH/NrfG
VVITPNDAAAFHNLGSLYARMNRYDNAIKAFEQSLRLRPNSSATQAELLQIQRQKHAGDEREF